MITPRVILHAQETVISGYSRTGLSSFVVSADSVNCFKNRLYNFWESQVFSEPETEVKWYFDSIEEIVIVYIRNSKQAQRHFCLRLCHHRHMIAAVF